MSWLDPYTLTVLGLIGTWILVLGTLFLMYWQTRQNQILNSAKAVLTLRERFDSDRTGTREGGFAGVSMELHKFLRALPCIPL